MGTGVVQHAHMRWHTSHQSYEISAKDLPQVTTALITPLVGIARTVLGGRRAIARPDWCGTCPGRCSIGGSIGSADSDRLFIHL